MVQHPLPPPNPSPADECPSSSRGTWRAAPLPTVATLAPFLAYRVSEAVLLGSSIGRSDRLVATQTIPPTAMLLAALVFFRFVPPLPVRGTRPSSRSLAVAAGLLVGSFAAFLNLLMMLMSHDAQSGRATLAVAAIVLHATALAPVAEELAFRGMLYRACRQMMTRNTAAISSATVFALMHHGPAQMLWAFAIGFALALLYEHTQSLLAPMLAHALFNTAPVLMALAKARPHDHSPVWLLLAAISLVFSIAAAGASKSLARPWQSGDA
jgi:membrane protease YdiL (CAAX protease family)